MVEPACRQFRGYRRFARWLIAGQVHHWRASSIEPMSRKIEVGAAAFVQAKNLDVKASQRGQLCWGHTQRKVVKAEDLQWTEPFNSSGHHTT